LDLIELAETPCRDPVGRFVWGASGYTALEFHAICSYLVEANARSARRMNREHLRVRSRARFSPRDAQHRPFRAEIVVHSFTRTPDVEAAQHGADPCDHGGTFRRTRFRRIAVHENAASKSGISVDEHRTPAFDERGSQSARRTGVDKRMTPHAASIFERQSTLHHACIPCIGRHTPPETASRHDRSDSRGQRETCHAAHRVRTCDEQGIAVMILSTHLKMATPEKQGVRRCLPDVRTSRLSDPLQTFDLTDRLTD